MILYIFLVSYLPFKYHNVKNIEFILILNSLVKPRNKKKKSLSQGPQVLVHICHMI